MSEKILGGVGEHIPHDSAYKHVSGEAVYIDDIPLAEGTCHGYILMSEKAHAKILRIDPSKALKLEGVYDFATAADIPGKNECGAIFKGEPILADGLVEYVGQPIAVIVAQSHELASRAATLVEVEYEELEPVLSIEEALEKESYVAPTHSLKLGDAAAAIENSSNKLEGELVMGGQDHFYLEGQIAMAVPGEDGDMLVYSSTQHPSEVQYFVAECLNQDINSIIVEIRRMGGGFGGKETQPAIIAACAALMSQRLGRAVKIRVCRDDDMIMTGKRHNFLIRYKVGFSDKGEIEGLDMLLASQCGNVADLSSSILDRALFHSDNVYALKNAELRGYPCKTNTVSNTAFRGFGGPQGMVAIEQIVDEIARHLGKDPLEIRKVNLYSKERGLTTPYHQEVEDFIFPEMLAEVEQSSSYHERVKEIAEFNEKNAYVKRGLALTPVKFGISFTTAFLNQAGALIHIYKDGSIHLNHGGTEMGQGLFTKVAQVVAQEFQVDVERIKITATTTAKVPNTSATAASSGSDLNGKAAQNAALKIKERLVAWACANYKVKEAQVKFENSQVHIGDKVLSFSDFVNAAYHDRVSLSSTGFYKTPKIYYDRENSRGRPFYYFAYGCCASEVELDVFTGEYRFVRSDILHEVGNSLNPAIDLGQVEGAFVQGVGWLTMEELVWNQQGSLMTHAPSTYKIPTCRDIPEDFRVKLKPDCENREETIYRSKAVGEPPFMLGISVWLALKDAVGAAADYKGAFQFDAPATPEAILMKIRELKTRGR